MLDGKLLNCTGSSTTQTAVSQSIAPPAQPLTTIPTVLHHPISALPSAEMIRDIVGELLDAKLERFQEVMLAGIRAELSSMRSDISSLSDRVKILEEKSSVSSAQLPVSSTDDVLEELRDREVRSKNIIIFGVPESQEPSTELQKTADVNVVREIVGGICPSGIQVLSARRLGKPGKSSCRPLCARLDSAADVRRVLRDKHQYKGPYKISEDKTRQQRVSLMQLREKLRELHEQGENHMTIRYIRGFPKIVSGRPQNTASQKN